MANRSANTNSKATSPSGQQPRRPRVLILSSCVKGGGVGRSLLTYLSRQSHAIEAHVAMPEEGVVAQHLPPGTQLHLVPEFVERVQSGPYPRLNRLGIRPLEFVGGIAAMFASGPKLVDIARRIQPDVIYCNHMIAKPIGAYVGQRTGTPVVFHARNVHVDPIGRAFYRFLAGLSQTKLVIANSRASAGPYEGAGAQVVVVPNFVDLSRFDPKAVSPTLRTTLGIASGAPVIGYLGRLVPKKGVDVLIRAFAEVHPEHPRAQLVLVGGNDAGQFMDREAEYKTLARELGVETHVHFAGFQDDVRPWAIDFDINVLPSVEPESFGRVLIEAGAFGVPSVTTAHGGAMEVVDDGETGLFCAPGDVHSLAGALRTLLDDPAQCAAMGKRAQQVAHERYESARIAERITGLLRGVAFGEVAPRPAAVDAEPAAHG